MLCCGVAELYGTELLEQIQRLGLRMRVAWIGSHLNAVVHDHFLRSLPVLFFSWVPNVLTSSDRFSRLHFPACDGALSPSAGSACDFEVHQLTKMMWSRLHTHTPEAHHLISQLHFSTFNLESLLLDYGRLLNDNSGFSSVSPADEEAHLDAVACNWVRENEDVWTEWLPDVLSSKQMIYLGGLFPMDGPFWRQPGIVPGKRSIFLENVNVNVDL